VNTRSLTFRLVAWYAVLLTAIFILLGALTLAAVRHYLDSNLLQDQARRGRQIADTLLAGVTRTDEGLLTAEVEALYAPAANDRFIRITRDDGRVVYVSGDPRNRSFSAARIPAVPLGRAGEFSRTVDLPGNGALLIFAVNHQDAKGVRYVVEVGMSTRASAATLEQLLRLLAIGLPGALLLAAAGGFVLVRRVAAGRSDSAEGGADHATKSERAPARGPHGR
jgi:hypothetical protein